MGDLESRTCECGVKIADRAARILGHRFALGPERHADALTAQGDFRLNRACFFKVECDAHLPRKGLRAVSALILNRDALRQIGARIVLDHHADHRGLRPLGAVRRERDLQREAARLRAIIRNRHAG